jgi:hypothetical protein
METSLHRSRKERYAAAAQGHREVRIEGFRIDAVLGPLRSKLRQLLPRHCIRIVKPVVIARRIIRMTRRDGPVASARRSPKRGALVDVFDDLIGVVRIFPHFNLEIEVLGVSIDELRVPRRRWPGYRVVDRCLGDIHEATSLAQAADLWALLPASSCDKQQPFTTRDLAAQLERPLWFAQRVAYCLRLTGAARVVGKAGNHRIYVREIEHATPAKPLMPRFGT